MEVHAAEHIKLLPHNVVPAHRATKPMLVYCRDLRPAHHMISP
jgi:hypothetical protein